MTSLQEMKMQRLKSKEIAEANPGKYVVITSEGEVFISQSSEIEKSRREATEWIEKSKPKLVYVHRVPLQSEVAHKVLRNTYK